MARKEGNWAPMDIEGGRKYVATLGVPIANMGSELVVPEPVAEPIPDSAKKVQDYAASLSLAMIQELADIARDEAMPPAVRRLCANDVINRGIGAPIQRIQSESVTADLSQMHLLSMRNRAKPINLTAKPDDGSDDAS